MSTTTGTPDLALPVEPVVAVEPVAVIPPAPVEKWHEYQPVDEQGRPIGGLQRIGYHNDAELIEKLTKNHTEAIKGMRDVKRKQRLGITDNSALPDDLDKMPTTVQFAAKELTVEERYAISQDMNDPSKFDEARDRLFESAMGVKPNVLRDTLNQQQQQTQQIVARQNAEVWMERHPEFYACSENVNTICDWMVKGGLQPTVKNFEYAQTTMNEAGLLLSSPIVREAPPAVPVLPVPVVEEIVPQPQALAVEPTRISEVPLPQEKRQSHVPSGLNNRTSSSTGMATPSATAALTLKIIDDMPSDEYRRQLTTNPEFVKRVNELEAARPPRPRR